MTMKLLWLKDFYWMHRGAVIGVAAAGAILVLQAVLVLVVARRLREVGHLRERLSRLADGLALLTDTTESGLSTLTRELQQLTRRPTARSRSRNAVSKRIVAAAQAGDDIPRIASSESLSESEVRLHMRLADSSELKG
jgi:hypothetical protein